MREVFHVAIVAGNWRLNIAQPFLPSLLDKIADFFHTRQAERGVVDHSSQGDRAAWGFKLGLNENNRIR